jgi:hypothetical protein
VQFDSGDGVADVHLLVPFDVARDFARQILALKPSARAPSAQLFVEMSWVGAERIETQPHEQLLAAGDD